MEVNFFNNNLNQFTYLGDTAMKSLVVILHVYYLDGESVEEFSMLTYLA